MATLSHRVTHRASYCCRIFAVL